MAVSHARSDIIAITDDDDFYLPQRFERELACMDADPNLGLCASFITCYETNDIFRRPCESEAIRICMLKNSPAAHSSWMVRKNLFERVNGYRDFYVPAEDYDLLARLSILPDVRFQILPEILVRYRMYPGENRQKMFVIQQKNANLIRLFLLQNLYPGMRKEYLPIHMRFVRENPLPIDEDLIPIVEKWGEILLNANRKTKVYNDELFESCIANRFAIFDGE